MGSIASTYPPGNQTPASAPSNDSAFDPATLIDPERLKLGLADRPATLAPAQHRAIVERVIEMYTALKRDQPAAPAAYQPMGEWVDYLAERQEFYTHLAAKNTDVVEAWLANFWRNPLGLIVKEYATYADLLNHREPNRQRFMHNVARNWLIWKEMFRQPTTALTMPNVGNVWGYMLDDVLITPKACRYHGMAQQILELTRDLRRPIVAEIGAGFGGLGYFLLASGLPLTIVVFDLPETLVLAAYYVQSAWPDQPMYFYGDSSELPTDADWGGYAAVFLPNYALRLMPNDSVDLHVNMFSLSEVGLEPLTAYTHDIARTTRHYFLHNNMDRRGVVNRGFERIPASEYPIDPSRLKLIYRHFDLYHGQQGDYRELLYQRLRADTSGRADE